MSGGSKVQTTRTEPWEQQKPYLERGFEFTEDLYRSGALNPAYYGGETVAGFTPAQQAAQQATLDYAGSRETDESQAAWRGRGMWGDTPLSRVQMGPGRLQASRHLPAMAGDYDPRADITDTSDSPPRAGLPQPDVEGYKYEYPVYSWGGTQDPTYSYVGHTTADIGEYPYYPYEPTGAPLRSKNDRVLIGQRLVPK